MVCSSHREFFHLENVPWLPIAVGVEGGEAAKWSATGDDRSDTLVSLSFLGPDSDVSNTIPRNSTHPSKYPRLEAPSLDNCQ